MGRTKASLLDARDVERDSSDGRNVENPLSLLGRLVEIEAASMFFCALANGAQCGKMRRSPSLRRRVSLDNRGATFTPQ